jgi:uncharacterized protein DUF4253
VPGWRETLTRNRVDGYWFYHLYGAGSEAIQAVVVAGPAALRTWNKLRALVDRTGCWPVILGGEADVESHLALLRDEEHRSAAEILRIAEGLDPRDVLNGLRSPEDHGHSVEVGEWPRRPGREDRFTIPADIAARRNSSRSVAIGLFPTRASWEVPAYLRYGNWNCCPLPEEHVCIMRYWAERHGAELVGMSHDTVEMVVSHPPTDRATALELAKEQLLYADLTKSGFDTSAKRAAVLLGSKVWSFWWD